MEDDDGLTSACDGRVGGAPGRLGSALLEDVCVGAGAGVARVEEGLLGAGVLTGEADLAAVLAVRASAGCKTKRRTSGLSERGARSRRARRRTAGSGLLTQCLRRLPTTAL